MKDQGQVYLENGGSVESRSWRDGWGTRGCLSNYAARGHGPAAHGVPRGLRGTEHECVTQWEGTIEQSTLTIHMKLAAIF